MPQIGFRARTKIALIVPALLVASFVAPASAGAAPILFEDFTNVGTLAGNGWAFVNNSTAPGTGWFQGNTGVFEAAGGGDGYAAANYLGTEFGEISNWMMLPELTVNDGDTISFSTKSNGALPDNLKVLFSPNGASTSVIGFTTLVLDINPTLGSGYPTDWTTFTATLSGLGGSTSGRFGFLYTIPDTSLYGDYVGVDDVSVVVAPVPEPASLTLLAIGLAGLGARRYRQTKAAA